MKKPQSSITLLQKVKAERKEAFDDVFKRKQISQGKDAREHVKSKSKKYLELTGPGGEFFIERQIKSGW